ncbi:acyltransferase [Carboxylicivirga sediminis]|uniref:Acyltransferase n=1 Tax=Carboxylicivirga sediminis TaxID=2006564 RepID=A0A941F6N2_9BACT|nr:acyltransferase [Carboxylicivirga sediminis]MBR8537502.1 acyltransferase [Carboxylicivirga sediminis]
MERRSYAFGELPTASKYKRAIRNLLLVPAWFCPVKKWRAMFHRWRGVKMGKNVEIGYMVILDNRRPELITIGDNAFVTAMSVVLTHDLSQKNMDGTETVGAIEIGEGAFIGMNCTIMPGVKIGKNSIIGSGAVLTRDTEDNSVYAGVPAKRIK